MQWLKVQIIYLIGKRRKYVGGGLAVTVMVRGDV